MKNSKLRRALMLLACAVLLVSLSVGATLAYLTSTTGAVTNTFTVGNVAITLDELKVDVYGEELMVQKKDEAGNVVKDETTGEPVMVESTERVTANTYKLLPGHNYIKDPTVHVAKDSEECYVFVKIVNAITEIEAETTIANQMKDTWTLVEGDATDGIYVYNKTVDARTEAKDVVVFEDFTLKTDANVSTYNGKTVTITAYAIQADGFDTYSAAWSALKTQEAGKI